MRKIITLEFEDLNGKKIIRSSGEDFSTLSNRHIDVLLTLPGTKDDEELQIWLGTARNAYEGGWYENALKYINLSLKRQPELEPYLFYYKRVCEFVLSIPLTQNEKLLESKRLKNTNRLNSLPKWLWWTVSKKEIYHMRCKWCGRYIPYVSPDDSSFGFIAGGINSCKHCGMSFPMPTWMWDSPDGRAYSYYRKSFPSGDGGKQFYNEFLRDYNPKPTVENSGLFKVK